MPISREDKEKLFIGGTGAAGVSLFRASPYKHLFEDQIDRARIVSDVDGIINWKRRFQIPKSDVDPRLTAAYVKKGTEGVKEVADKIFKDYLDNAPQEYKPSDISRAGEYLLQRQDNYGNDNIFDIMTVTPEPQTQRFAGTELNIGGGSSNTVWGSTGDIRPSYAVGNTRILTKAGRNPTVHISGAELPPKDRRDYLTTSESQGMNPQERGWGMSNDDLKKPLAGSNRDIHFGLEHRRLAGSLSAADMYTILKNNNYPVPAVFELSSPETLQELTDMLHDHAGTKTQKEAILKYAIPEEVGETIKRETGQIPRGDNRDWRVTSDTSRKIGEDKFFKRAGAITPEQAYNTNPNDFVRQNSTANQQIYIDRHLDDRLRRFRGDALDEPITIGDTTYTHSPGMRTEFDSTVKPTVHGRALTKRFAPGIVGTIATGPEAAAKVREGNYAGAAGDTAVGYLVGEGLGGTFNAALQALSSRAPEITTRLVQGARVLGNTLNSPAFIGPAIMDTASTLMTGKNARELAVESGNTKPFIAASMAPMTMAPLGMAGHINATVPVPADQQRRPQKVMAMSNGEEGYMLQGDPSSFIRGNWNPLQRRRYYAGGRVGDLD